MNAKTAVIIIIALIAIGVGGFAVGQKYKLVPQETATPTPTQQLLGGDRDAHGCIGSAGYSWCEIKQKCLRVWEEPCGEATTTPPVSLAPTVNETMVLQTVIKQQIVAKRGSSANNLTITVSKIDGNYATGGASAEGGGAMWLAAKVNGSWKLAWDGNGTIGCTDIAAYNFSVSMVPECWNDATQKLITR